MTTKSIVCIRHGESTFNAAWRRHQVDEVLSRPEQHTAVVGHGTFLFHLTGRVLANCETAEVWIECNGSSLADVTQSLW